MEQARVAEVYRTARPGAGGAVGSGYLVADGLVLTAHHVVGEGGASVSVRLLGETEWQEARHLWRDTTLDVALLSCPQRIPSSPPRFGRLATTDPTRWSAVGFPGVAREKSAAGASRNTFQVWGSIAPASLHKSVFARANLAGDSPEPEALELWAGMSGAAVFAPTEGGGHRLVGVVIAAPRNLSGRALDYAPFEQIVACEGFPLDRLGGPLLTLDPVGQPGAVMNRGFRFELAGELYSADRRAQLPPAEVAAYRCLDPAYLHPVLAFACGEAADAMDLLIERFERDILPATLRQTARRGTRPAVRMRQLDWPSSAGGSKGAATHLRATLLRELHWPGDKPALEYATEDAALEEIGLRLQRDRAALAFCTHIRGDRFGARGEQVLTEWLAFWDRIAALRVDVPVFYLLLLETERAARPGLLSKVGRLFARRDPLLAFAETVLRPQCGTGEDGASVVRFYDLGQLDTIDLSADVMPWVRADALRENLRLSERRQRIVAERLRGAVEAGKHPELRLEPLRGIIHATDFSET